MKRIIILFIIIISLLSSCIPSYKGLGTDHFTFSNTASVNSTEKIRIVVSDTILFKDMIKGKKGIHFVPLKVINNDTLSFIISNSSVTVFNDYEPVDIIDQEQYYKKIKFRNGKYLAVGSLGIIMSLGISSEGLNPSYKHPGLLLPISAAGYMFAAYKANKRLKYDLFCYDLLGKEILPGSEVKGFICISTDERKEIRIRIEQQ